MGRFSKAITAAALCMPAAVSADGVQLHTFHCLAGCPVGAPANDDVVVREIYTLASNPLTRLADWVAYRITPDTIGPSQDRDWAPDPALAGDETLRPRDYDGASAALRVDRGPQAPLAAFSGTPFAAQTNILSNITPQSSALNQGPWQRLEAKETALARTETTTVYVVTGPLYERLMEGLPKGPGRHRVPSGYWKVVATADGRRTAFIFDQQAGRSDDLCTARVPIAELELRSRLLIHPGPDGPATWRALDAQLGCPEAAPTRPAPERIREEGR